jgi:PAS domain S-box-containing protein
LVDDAGSLRREIESLRAAREAADAAQRRFAFLSEAGQKLSTSLDYSTTLESVARLAVPAMGDMCIVMLEREPGGRLEVEAAHALPEHEVMLRAYLDDFASQPPRDELPLYKVARTGETELVVDVDEAYLKRAVGSDEQLRLAQAIAPTSILTVALRGRTRTLGALVLVLTRPDRAYGAEDAALAEDLARRAAVAIEHALLHRAERRAREELRESEERYRLAERATNTYLWAIHFERREIAYSDAVERVFGHVHADIPTTYDESYAWWLAQIFPGDRERVKASFDAAMASADDRWIEEYRLRRGDGSYALVLDRAFIARNERGEPAQVVGSVQDITEPRELRERLAMADRMASIGALAAGVAHEINNPLAYVSANLGALSRALGEIPEEARSPAVLEPLGRCEQALAEARDGVARVAEIVRDLKSISREAEDKRAPMDVHAAIEVAVKVASVEVSPRARVVKEYGRVPLVLADEARLAQVFINLLVNAAQAMSEGAGEANEIRVVTRTDPEGRAVVEVRDTGPGIAPDVLRRVFEPFFTTKPVGVGTGMGLSICHGIVSAHGGELTAESEVGAGTVFRVALPACAAEQQEARSVAPAAKSEDDEGRRSSVPPTKRGRVLVVDDEVKLGSVIQKELSTRHEVEFLTSGKDALARLQGGARFDLILCDLLMPAMSGIALYQELQALAPDQARRMVFLTGGAFNHTAETFLHEVGNVCLEKPFNLEQLHAVVHEVIGSAA